MAEDGKLTPDALADLFAGTFLADLAGVTEAEMEALVAENCNQPDESQGEEIIGELEPLELRLFALSVRLAKTIVALKPRYEAAEDETEKRLIVVNEVCALNHHMAAIRSLAWSLVRDRLNRHHDNLGYRKGGVVVTLPKEERSILSGGRVVTLGIISL